ncbi:hypothetical protein CH75_03045 [Dyella jiangningensis]|nr:hypothetical protein CH75_03045 [Dyella jiangningensis]
MVMGPMADRFDDLVVKLLQFYNAKPAGWQKEFVPEELMAARISPITPKCPGRLDGREQRRNRQIVRAGARLPARAGPGAGRRLAGPAPDL